HEERDGAACRRRAEDVEEHVRLVAVALVEQRDQISGCVLVERLGGLGATGGEHSAHEQRRRAGADEQAGPQESRHRPPEHSVSERTVARRNEWRRLVAHRDATAFALAMLPSSAALGLIERRWVVRSL